MGLHDPIVRLLVQVALVLAVSRAIGLLFARLRQPQVMGEMVAGILLGPSFLGWVWPHAQQALFPAVGMDLLQHLSQLGVIFFLFLIGLELDVNLIRSRGRTAVAIGVSSIVVPFALGATLALYLYARGRFVLTDPQHQRTLATSLFMGAAMGITAFPVLARILVERNLHRTRPGAVAIACAALNDAAAWVILAFVIAVAGAAGPGKAIVTLALTGGYAVFLFLVVRPFLRRLQLVHERQGRLSQNVLAVIFLLILVSAWASALIGIHAMFGAFLIGVIMPKGTQFVRNVGEKLEDFTVIFLLPLFFAYTGLKTQLGLISGAGLWIDALLIICIACIGKFGGSSLAARACGMPWRDASTIGVLMNTRGLMELVILDVGVGLGIVPPGVFAMMVLMALATTAMTTPALHLVYPQGAAQLPPAVATQDGDERRAGKRSRRGIFSVLIPVADPRSGGPLLMLAELIAGAGASAAGPRASDGANADERATIYALHLRRPREQDAYRAGEDRTAPAAAATARPAPPEDATSSLRPLLEHAARRNIHVEPLVLEGRDPAAAIARVAGERQVDLVLTGFHRAVIGNAVLGGTVHRMLAGVRADVGVFVERGFLGAQRVLVPYLGGSHDRLALMLAARIARHAEAEVTVLHVVAPGRVGAKLNAGGAVERAFNEPGQPVPVRFKVVEDAAPVEAVLREASAFDLVIVGVAEEWGSESHLFGFRAERIASGSTCSLLLVRKYGNVETNAAGADVSPSAAAATSDVGAVG